MARRLSLPVVDPAAMHEAGPSARVFFDASPGMVHDLSGEPDDPAAAPAPAPSLPVVPPALLAEREAELAALRPAADGLPLGSDVGVALTRAAKDAGASDAEAVTAEWLCTFAAHGIAQNDAHDVIAAGLGVAKDGPPSEEFEAARIAETKDRLAREYGGAEPAERAADLAAAFVASRPCGTSNSYLGLRIRQAWFKSP